MLGSIRPWEKLPEDMQTDAVRPYYDVLKKKRVSLFFKRLFDIVAALVLLTILSPVMAVLAIAIACDSKGGVFFRQERVTQYERRFRIFKFRTMVANAEALGSQVTVSHDVRITKVGRVIRRCRLDEIPQLLNILAGDMSFVGTRPETVRFVNCYSPEMMATLLMPAGVTSEASIRYKDEDRLLKAAEDADDVYVNRVLPEKMRYNLDSIKNFRFFGEIGIMIRTVAAVLKKESKTPIDTLDTSIKAGKKK